MNQLDFRFAKTHARRTDPDTSHEAAGSVAQFLEGHKATILDALETYGPQTIDEIAKRTNLDSVQIARRMPDLLELHLVELTGEKRKGLTGRRQRVWTAVP